LKRPNHSVQLNIVCNLTIKDLTVPLLSRSVTDDFQGISRSLNNELYEEPDAGSMQDNMAYLSTSAEEKRPAQRENAYEISEGNTDLYEFPDAGNQVALPTGGRRQESH